MRSRRLDTVVAAVAVAGAIFMGDANAAAPPAKRLITLSPALTELAFAAGAGHLVVGVSAYSDHPLAARALPAVADAVSVNTEAILALKPDVVLAWKGGSGEKSIANLTNLGIRVEWISIARINDVPRAMRAIGAFAGVAARVEPAAKSYEARLAALQKKYATNKPLRAFAEISRKPLMTVNSEHFIAGVFELCGVKNIFGNIGQMVFEPTREQLLQLAPDVIIYGRSAARREARPTEFDTALYAGVNAATAANMIGVEADHLLRPGPRLIDAAEALCRVVSARGK